MKTEQQLPKNIRQIGSPAGHTKVYIEDYVITFLNSLSMDKNTYVRGAILFGEKKQIGNDLVIFIRGAIEGQNLELDLDETVFDDEVWREIYQQKERLFSGLDVIGWALLRMGFSVRLNDKIKKTHFENFPGEGKVLYMMDDLEGEDAFYVFRGEDLSRQNGYYIYYEKNPMMQNYLVERRQDIKEVQTYEKMMESRRDEKLIRQFREKISKKTKSNQRKGRIRIFDIYKYNFKIRCRFDLTRNEIRRRDQRCRHRDHRRRMLRCPDRNGKSTDRSSETCEEIWKISLGILRGSDQRCNCLQ